MNAGQAVNDTSTALGRAAAQSDAWRRERLARAEEIRAAEGVSLEEAVSRVWAIQLQGA